MRTRYEERKRKRKQNFILNVLIGIVFICIVVVGIQIISDPSSQTESSQQQQLGQDKRQTAKNDENDDTYNGDGNNDEKSEESSVQETRDGYMFVDGGPSGPWHPIGTKQTGEHVTTFEKGSLDWEEMEMAIAYGAGIDRNNMTVLWIGNGGNPQRAKGKVKSNDDPNTIYHVLIEWVDEKGWKPIEVTIEQ